MLKELFYSLIEYIKTNTGKSIGLILGLIISISMLTLGFFKTLFIVLCMLLGYIIGDRIDKGERFSTFIDKIFSDKR